MVNRNFCLFPTTLREEMKPFCSPGALNSNQLPERAHPIPISSGDSLDFSLLRLLLSHFTVKLQVPESLLGKTSTFLSLTTVRPLP